MHMRSAPALYSCLAFHLQWTVALYAVIVHINSREPLFRVLANEATAHISDLVSKQKKKSAKKSSKCGSRYKASSLVSSLFWQKTRYNAWLHFEIDTCAPISRLKLHMIHSSTVNLYVQLQKRRSNGPSFSSPAFAPNRLNYQSQASRHAAHSSHPSLGSRPRHPSQPSFGPRPASRHPGIPRLGYGPTLRHQSRPNLGPRSATQSAYGSRPAMNNYVSSCTWSLS